MFPYLIQLAYTIHRLAYTCFLEIVFVQKVIMRVCVYTCVCVHMCVYVHVGGWVRE